MCSIMCMQSVFGGSLIQYYFASLKSCRGQNYRQSINMECSRSSPTFFNSDCLHDHLQNIFLATRIACSPQQPKRSFATSTQSYKTNRIKYCIDYIRLRSLGAQLPIPFCTWLLIVFYTITSFAKKYMEKVCRDTFCSIFWPCCVPHRVQHVVTLFETFRVFKPSNIFDRKFDLSVGTVSAHNCLASVSKVVLLLWRLLNTCRPHEISTTLLFLHFSCYSYTRTQMSLQSFSILTGPIMMSHKGLIWCCIEQPSYYNMFH